MPRGAVKGLAMCKTLSGRSVSPVQQAVVEELAYGAVRPAHCRLHVTGTVCFPLRQVDHDRPPSTQTVTQVETCSPIPPQLDVTSESRGPRDAQYFVIMLLWACYFDLGSG